MSKIQETMDRATTHADQTAAMMAECRTNAKEQVERALQTLEESNAISDAALDAKGKALAELTLAQKDIGTRERATLLKILMGLAIASYSHDPSAGRTGAAAQMVSELAQFGFLSMKIPSENTYGNLPSMHLDLRSNSW